MTGADPPELIVVPEANAPQPQNTPAVAASYRAKCVTVPQLAVGAGKVMAVPLLIDRAAAAGKFVAFFVTPTRAYAPPTGSVTFVPVFVGAVVDSATK